ncbi:MAG: CvpA family protein [Clostridia bacterium]|nr:CvpA family protein [Clostridia bacterium]
MLFGLNASWVHYALDGIVLVLIVAFAASSAKKGFVECFFGFISTILAIVTAFLFMKGVLSWTGGLFGLQDVIENAVVGGLGKITGFDIDVSAAGIEAALADKNLPSFLVNAVIESVGNQELPLGTTLAMVVGGSIAEFTATLIAWFLVFLLVKLLLKLVQRVLTSIVENLPIVGSLNHLLGFVVGGLQGLLIACGVIAVVALIPAEGLNAFFNECLIVRWLYNSNPIHVIFSWIIH